MKKLTMFIILLIAVFSMTACGVFSKSEPPPTPVTTWQEAPYNPDSLNLGAVTGSEDEDNSLDLFGQSSYATPGPLDTDFFGSQSTSEWSEEELNLSNTLLPEEDENSLDFFFGTPLETGNEFDSNLPPLESGLPLETGTGQQTDFTPATGTANPTPLPLEVNDDDRNNYAEEELQQPPQDLPKTSDPITTLSIATVGLATLVLLILFVKYKGVRA